MSATRLLKSFTPPLLWNIANRFKRRMVRSTTLLAYAPAGWATPLPDCSSSDAFWSAFIAQEEASCRALIARVRAGEPLLYEDGNENAKYSVFGHVLALAARHRDTMSILDYGGNLGDYYWLGRAFMPDVQLNYHCKELPSLAEAGRQVSPEVTWHTDDGCFAAAYDLVMFSSSINCLPDWQDILRRAGQSARGYLLLSDVPTVRNVPTYVATHRSGGHTTLLMAINQSEIIKTIEQTGLRLVREFPMGSHPAIANAPEQPGCAGFLFQRA